MPWIHRMLATGLIALALVSGITTAEAATILITPTDDDRGIDSFLDGNFMCCQWDDGLATVTLNPVDIAMAPVFIQTLLAADGDFAGFMLRNVKVPSGVFTIWTVDSGFEDLYPTVAVDYELVPEPGSLLLVGTALILGARRARRTREVP